MEFYEKWRWYFDKNPNINDEIIESIKNLQNKDRYLFIASQIEKSCLNLIENEYSKTIN